MAQVGCCSGDLSPIRKNMPLKNLKDADLFISLSPSGFMAKFVRWDKSVELNRKR